MTFLTLKLFCPNPDEAFLKDFCPILLIQKLIFEEFLKDLCPILLIQKLIFEEKRAFSSYSKLFKILHDPPPKIVFWPLWAKETFTIRQNDRNGHIYIRVI